ncbi:RDD family protein [Clostridium algidicarnis]|uniref:RDD family protein n=1 Tax=Clostridium algidicarnis TaxID=37659 RepID=A0ABS6C0P2_9CLOT|nr:RDD family protein [Clostridium algidicarnis]MBB6630031.1 RDD family protein [Clostridium algidicarnis]MBB6696964.1 RDD family protein [Clostridium algidicarnis]MBU3196995.1 RDD family protein [Clostridium algidicarnis]MBU3204669.1 RDD family protein [Clostridium algidicarnis]MBU3206623.1 RDD family protein [Clostridium algidicarnis]
MKFEIINRLGSLIIDLLISIAMPLVIFKNLGLNINISYLYCGVLYIIFLVLLPIITKGYTIGKYLFNLKICSKDETSVSPIQILYREVAKLMYTIPLLGLILIFFSFYLINTTPNNQGIHDIFANTKVIKI